MNTAEQAFNKNLSELYNELQEAEAASKHAANRLKYAKKAVLDYFKDEADVLYRQKPEPFGVVNITAGNYKFTIDTPKKVEWDQNELAKLYLDGFFDIEVEYNIKESVYKEMTDNLKKYFQKARTVKPGSQTLKVEVL